MAKGGTLTLGLLVVAVVLTAVGGLLLALVGTAGVLLGRSAALMIEHAREPRDPSPRG